MKKIGSLYQVKKNYWLLFPSKEIATHFATIPLEGYDAATHAGSATQNIASAAAYWSIEYNCNVTYASQEDIVVLLETDGKYKKLLTAKGEMGWTWFVEHYNGYFEEVTQP